MTPFQRRIIIAIGRGHASAQEVAAEIGSNAASVSRAMFAMTRMKPQVMHLSGANEALPVPDVTDSATWDEWGNDRLQLTEHGLTLLPSRPRLVRSAA